jgi:hypothetical protein
MELLAVQFFLASCHERSERKEETRWVVRFERSQSLLNFNWLYTLVLYVTRLDSDAVFLC